MKRVADDVLAAVLRVHCASGLDANWCVECRAPFPCVRAMMAAELQERRSGGTYTETNEHEPSEAVSEQPGVEEVAAEAETQRSNQEGSTREAVGAMTDIPRGPGGESLLCSECGAPVHPDPFYQKAHADYFKMNPHRPHVPIGDDRRAAVEALRRPGGDGSPQLDLDAIERREEMQWQHTADIGSGRFTFGVLLSERERDALVALVRRLQQESDKRRVTFELAHSAALTQVTALRGRVKELAEALRDVMAVRPGSGDRARALLAEAPTEIPKAALSTNAGSQKEAHDEHQ